MSNSVEFNIESIGDLLRGLTLEIDLPSIEDISGFYTDNVGCAAIDRVEFIVNGQVIQSLWGEWISIYQQLVEPFGKQDALGEMRGGNLIISRDGAAGTIAVYGTEYKANTVRIPLPFWFSRTSGVALPLVALKHTDVRVRVLLRRFDQLVYDDQDPTGSMVAYNSKSYGSVQLFADVVHLDKEERASLVENPLEYLIETVQRNTKVLSAARNQLGGQTPQLRGTPDPKVVLESVPLQLSMPVKELIWIVQPQPNSTVWCNLRLNRWLEFPNNEYDASARPYVDLIQEATLRVGGQSIFENEKGSWFRLEQPVRYHTNVPVLNPQADSKAIYVHSFAIRPEEYQPSGTMNFSAVDKAELILAISRPSKMYQVVVFAWGYNILRIQNGLGGLVYSY
jgi:hypothetical protein